MDDSIIISKINDFSFRLNQQMIKWLSSKLPKITDDWWQEMVLDNLSYLQRLHVNQHNITTLNGLDLAAILRIIDRNWFVITSQFFINNKEREKIKDMITIRNSWAHITSSDISKDKTVSDIAVIISLMEAFDSPADDIRDAEAFQLAVEDDEAIPEKNQHSIDDAKTDQQSGSTEINVTDEVTLVSDPSKVGLVAKIEGNRYSVFLDGKIQMFFKEQIRRKNVVETVNTVSLGRLKSSLTAYQINNPGSTDLYSLNSARIDFVPYQFRPALKLIHSDSPRILVADDVGVGKTIEAGLIMKEMEARSSCESVLVICPKALVSEHKWEMEMKRFDEDFTALDGKMFASAISDTDRDGEWPDKYAKSIIPYSLFSEDSIMGRQSKTARRKKNIGLCELDPLPHFDLLIVDEAHTIRNPDTWYYQGVSLFAQNADAVVLLTATPVQNKDNDLYTLLNLIRPDVVIDQDTFRTLSEPNRYVNNLLRIVRNQQDGWQEEGIKELTNIVGTTWGRNVTQHNPNFAAIYEMLEHGDISRDERIDLISKIESLHSFSTMINRTRRKDIEDFCIRRSQTVRSKFTPAQKELYDALMIFEEKSLALIHSDANVRFMMCTIMRQASSCIYGLAPFMDALVHKRIDQIAEDGELLDSDVLATNYDEDSLYDLQRKIKESSAELPPEDPKFDKLYTEVISKKQEESNNKIILFSSFRNTLSYIRRKLRAKGLRVAQVDGSVPPEERFKLSQRFQLDRDDPDAIDIMLFSEVGSEGLDYQFCDTMVNYDLPWNPMRIEQRIGRIDRRGQKSDTVRIYNMVTEGTIDAVIFDRCLSKIDVFESSVGDCSEILGQISDEIQKIMMDPTLTESEREYKIDKMADNKVASVQELRKLEQEEKSLYGFDLSNYIQNKDVQDAENTWISPSSIQNLISIYLNDKFGKGDYIRGKQDLKTLTLSIERRQQMLEDLDGDKIIHKNNSVYKVWRSYLRSNRPQLKITFDSTCAKEKRDAVFLTQMHPLVLMAAEYESQDFPCEILLESESEAIPKGEYTFLIYAWKYVGLRPDIKLIAISDDESVENNLFSVIQFAAQQKLPVPEHEEEWKALDSRHYERWSAAAEDYRKDVRNECEYRLDQSNHYYINEETRLNKAIQTATSENIIRMRTAELARKQTEFEAQKRKMEETIQKADIHTTQLVKGILRIL